MFHIRKHNYHRWHNPSTARERWRAVLVQQTAMVRELSRDGRVGARKRSGPKLLCAVNGSLDPASARDEGFRKPIRTQREKEGNASKRSPSAGDLRTFVSRCAHIAYDCPPLIWKGPGFGPRYWGGFPQRRGGGHRVPPPHTSPSTVLLSNIVLLSGGGGGGSGSLSP